MEIRCDKCTHVGPAADVRPGPQGVVLVCENCGHENVLDLGAGKPEQVDEAQREPAGLPGLSQVSPSPLQKPVEPVEGSAGAKLTESLRQRGADFSDNEQVRTWLREDALEALIPEPGVGPRCRKCAQLLPADADNCKRCGLNRREAERFAPGEAPWEQPPAGKEAAHEQAELLWQAFKESPGEEALEKFVNFVRDEGLLDLGIRKLRFYLVEHPEDADALAHLRDLAESLQSRIIIAQVQAQASADEFKQDVSRFKQRVMVTALVFWGGIFLLFLVFFWDNCGSSMPSL